MKKAMVLIIVGLIAFCGCGKKEKSVTNQENRRYLIEGAVFLKQGEPVKAIESFAASIKANPKDFDGYFMLGETFIRLKQYPQAHAVLSAATQLFPDNGAAYYLLALAANGQGQTVPAVVAARRSVELFMAKGDKSGAEKATMLLSALVTNAKKAQEQKMVENAAQDAQKAVAVRVEEKQPEAVVTPAP